MLQHCRSNTSYNIVSFTGDNCSFGDMLLHMDGANQVDKDYLISEVLIVISKVQDIWNKS